MRGRPSDQPIRSEGATLNPRLLTLPARFRNATTPCASGAVIISASQPLSPLSAPHLGSPQAQSVPRPRLCEATHAPSDRSSINPFVDLTSARNLSSKESSQSDSPLSRAAIPDRCKDLDQSNLGMASVETAATTTVPKRSRKLRISLARKAEGMAHILRANDPTSNITTSQQKSKEVAQQNRQNAQIALDEARRRWNCAMEKIRRDVNMAHDVLIPDLTDALEKAERALFISTLSGLCLEAARQGRSNSDSD